MFHTATVLSVLFFHPFAGEPEHPCVVTTQAELAEAHALTSSEPFRGWLNLLKSKADDAPAQPRIAGGGPYDLDDWECLYHGSCGGSLSSDASDIVNNAFAYHMTGETRYRDKAIQFLNFIVDHIDVSDPTIVGDNVWWFSITMDIAGINLAMGIDLLWHDLADADRADALWFLGQVAQGVKILHEAGKNGRHPYEDSLGNIKSWDNALMAASALLSEDEALANYVVESPDNKARNSSVIMNLLNAIQVGIVEVEHGTNSEYGIYRYSDYERSAPESIGYQCYHHEAQTMAAQFFRNKLQLDFFHHEGEKLNPFPVDRHHLMMVITRLALFATGQVPPEDNQWGTPDGRGGWSYTPEDRYLMDVYGLIKLGLSLGAFRSTEQQAVKDRFDHIMNTGMYEDGLPRFSVHMYKWAWPVVYAPVYNRGLRSLGKITGTAELEGGGHGGIRISMDVPDDLHGSLFLPAVPANSSDGIFEVNNLPQGEYLVRLGAEGHRSTLIPISLGAGGEATIPDVTLPEGKCEITPRRSYFSRRRDFDRVRFRYENPDGLGEILSIRVIGNLTGHGEVDLWPQFAPVFQLDFGPTWFELSASVAGREELYRGFTFLVEERDPVSGTVWRSGDKMDYPLR